MARMPSRMFSWTSITMTLCSLVALFQLSAADAPASSTATVSFVSGSNDEESRLHGARVCGAWLEGDEVRVNGLDVAVEFVCEGGDLTRSLPTAEAEYVTRDSCMQWCAGVEHNEANGWCCHLLVSPTGDACTWTNGRPTLVQADSNDGHSSAFTKCADGIPDSNAGKSTQQARSAPAAEPRLVAAPQAMQAGEYQCPSGKKQNAMKLDGDGPGLCSQICLPHAFWGPARNSGVIEGYCWDYGYSHFEYSSSNTGVHYNVYSAP